LRSSLLYPRKQNLAQLLARRPDGITVAPFERGEIGTSVIDRFRAKPRAAEFGSFNRECE
jgi:hypothetical protein